MGLITLRNLKPEKVVSDGHGHHCGWHEHRCMGRTYVQYIFVSLWRLDGRIRCGCHCLPVTDCYADYSRFFSLLFLIHGISLIHHTSYLIYKNSILDSYDKILTYSNSWTYWHGSNLTTAAIFCSSLGKRKT